MERPVVMLVAALQPSCCNDPQVVWAATTGLYLVAFWKLYAASVGLGLSADRWRTPLLFPVKLLVYFTHEVFRSVAVVLSCGKVDDVAIHPEEGSETTFTGGSPGFVLLLGYLGTMLWGLVQIYASLYYLPTVVCTGVTLALLVGFSVLSDTRFLRVMTVLSFLSLLALLVYALEAHSTDILPFVTLFIGVAHALFFVLDADDGFRVHPSDCLQCSEVYGPCATLALGLLQLGLFAGAVAVAVLERGGAPAIAFDTLAPLTQLVCLCFIVALFVASVHSLYRCKGAKAFIAVGYRVSRRRYKRA
ncbi:hypothetical protein ACHHYP_20016 [Achlya hypogyna]|uniref:Uncharacterized protein n=1 Tax=Achlya hypogyna TaxID=1202772 RepID=A0A1V9ZBC9_ACHHY|nr:hypothetical protein ACHHYP_20016 [Achlya hypogyna]